MALKCTQTNETQLIWWKTRFSNFPLYFAIIFIFALFYQLSPPTTLTPLIPVRFVWKVMLLFRQLCHTATQPHSILGAVVFFCGTFIQFCCTEFSALFMFLSSVRLFSHTFLWREWNVLVSVPSAVLCWHLYTIKLSPQ